MATLGAAGPSDAAVLAAISIEVWMGTYLRGGIDAFFARYALDTFTEVRVAAWLTDPFERAVVSEAADGLDGFARVSLDRACPVEGGGEVELAILYLRPARQGTGIGKALLRQAMEVARATGAARIWLSCNSENPRAIAFYRGQGFDEVGTTAFRIGDRAYPNLILSRRV